MDQQPSEPPTPHSVARSESPLFFMDDTPRRQGRRRSTTGEGEETTAPGEEEEEERDKEDHDHSDVDLDADPHMKLMALVAEKRKELEAKEKEEAKKRRRREVDVERDGDDDDDNNGGDNDGEDEDEEEGRDEPAQGEGEDTDDSMDGIIDAYPEHQQQKENPRKKQQRKQPKQPKKPKEPNQPKPRQQRKASKKAIEDMHRETQRIARNMQLTHEATTKKKITMDSFLSRFSRKNQAENKTSQDTGANGQAEVASSPPAATDKESAQVRNEVHDGLSASRPTSGHRDGSSGKEAALDEEEDALPSATDLIDRLKSDPQSFQPQSQPRPSSPSPSKSPGEATQPDPFIVDAGTGQTHFQDHETSSSTKRTNRPKLSETKQVRVRLSRQAVAQHQEEASSDEDLEIVTNPAKARPIAVFERIPYRVQQRQREASGWSKQLRMLAQLPSSPPREPALSADGRGSANMTQKELELTLLKRARQQAAREREERINELKAKGVVLDAPEDRMEVEMEVEDLIEKARQEGKDLKKQEKMAEKAEQKKNNPKYFDDPDEDSEWDGEEEEDEEGDSEEEKDEEGEEQEEQGQGEDRRSEHDAGSGDEAGIDEKVDRAPVAEPVSQSEQSTIPDLGLPKDNAPTMGLSQAFESTLAEGASGDPSGTSKMNGGDAHDNSQNPFVQSSKDKDNKSPSLSLSQAFASTLSDPTASANPMASTTGESQKEQPPDIGSGDNNDVISLSQAFQSTFAEPEKTPGDNNNVSGDDEKKAKEQESLAMLRNMSNPESQRPDVMLPSQESPYQPGLDVFATPAKGTVITDKDYSITPATRSRYSFSQAPPEPTQDQGFVYSPFDQRKRFLSVDHSTQSPLKGDYNDNINVLGTPIPSRSSDNHSLHPSTDAERISETPSRNERNAFDTLRNNLEENKHSKPSKAKSKREGKRFDKNDSKAKEVVDDAALESDDEYAGLGGVSDDSDEDGDELDREMINDDNGEAVDEKQLAAMNAEHNRHKDEVEVNKLFHDITTGALRRRRRHPGGGNDYDLSDSDEDRYIARRRAKQREFARMRRNLLEADEKLGTIAHDPKKSAFMRTIEDRVEDEEGFDFGPKETEDDGSDDNDNDDASREASATERVLDSQTSGLNSASTSEAGGTSTGQTSQSQDAPSANHHMKNRKSSKRKDKAKTLAEVRESLAFLVGGVDAGMPSQEPNEPLSEDSDEEMDFDDSPEDNESQNIPKHSGSADAMVIDDDDDKDDDNDELGGPFEASPTANHTKPPSQTARSKPKFVDRLHLRRTASINAATAASNKPAAYGGKENQAHILKGPTPLLRKISKNASDSAPRPVTTRDSRPAASTAATASTSSSSSETNATKHSTGVNYYAVARERQRELELRANERAVSSKTKSMGKKTAKIAAARKNSGGGLTKWLATKEDAGGGFE